MKNLFTKKSRIASTVGAVVASAAFSLALTACSDDSNPSDNVSVEEQSSSSEEESSSSEEEVSSSSQSESDLPKGTRAATLDDLEKHYSLGSMFGTEVFLATGAKRGTFSLWIPDTAWVAFRSDFKDGIVEFSESSKNVGYAGAKAAVADSMHALLKGTKFQFVVDSEGKLQYSMNDGDFKDMEVAKFKSLENTVTNGKDLVGKNLACKDSLTFSFYDGRYVLEDKAKKTWQAGYYDIQMNKLLMLPVFYDQSADAMNSYSVSTDYSLTALDYSTVECETSSLKYSEIDFDKISEEWTSGEDGYDWSFVLKNDGKYELRAIKNGKPDIKNGGRWDIYGDVLLIQNTTCLEPSKCMNAFKGKISDFDASKGFNFNHNNTEEPAMPKAWKVVEYL